ncbi:hypothetical protein GCM10009828_102560 [Actinoplanes couchii]|uniref:Uncharacterized protein n=1 Tax=Actinoplanes couchii TaxID=403638 RepID=A0ABQ3XSA8_9ACTN|nr:hypothetical protein Aco03nite_098010 [Actinoplanes couchii]
MIDLNGDPGPPGSGDQLRRLLDRLRPVHLRTLLPGGAPGRVDGRTPGPQLNGDLPPSATRRPGNESNFPCQILFHEPDPASKT